MAAAHVQTAFHDANPVSTISVTLTLTAANAVIVTLISGGVGLGSLSGLAQTAGDTLTLAGSLDNSGTYQAQYINYSVAGGSTTFTFTWTGATYMSLYAEEVSGLMAAGADQVASTVSAVSTTLSSGTTATLSQADEFALATWNLDGSGSTSLTSVSNSFTVPANGSQLSTAVPRALLAYKVVSATTAVETTATLGDASTWTGLIVTYKAAATAPANSAQIIFRKA